MGNYEFDLDLPEGQVGEAIVRDILSGELGPIEVKRDFIVSQSRKIAVEFEYRGRPSGIKTTKAIWWAFVLDGNRYGHEIVIIIRTSRLRTVCDHYLKRSDFVSGGDDKKSKMVLIPLSQLVLWDPPVIGPTLPWQ